MNMDGNIRVRTAKNLDRFYNEMSNCVVMEFHELFYIAACIAYRRGKSSKIEQSRDAFFSRTITPDEWATYYSLILEKNAMDFSSIRDDKAVIREVEEYANAGVGILLDEVLADYVIEKKGELSLDRSCLQELPKVFMHYVFEQGSSVEKATA